MNINRKANTQCMGRISDNEGHNSKEKYSNMTLSPRKLCYLHLDRHWLFKKKKLKPAKNSRLDKWTIEVKEFFFFQGEKDDNLASILGLFLFIYLYFFKCHITAKNLDIYSH